jgi:hypothetical protein
MAEICQKSKNYDFGIKCLLNALEYVWYFKKQDYEIYIYDKVGMFYYLLGDIKKAAFYH